MNEDDDQSIGAGGEIDLDKTIPSDLNNPQEQSPDSDMTLPMGVPRQSETAVTGLGSSQYMDTIGMAATHVVPLNDSDTAATLMSPNQQAAGFAGDNCSGQVWGDFELGKKIGQGGMGAVYLGRQISLDRPVAIKVLPSHLSQDESFRKRFDLEAKAVAQINSPYIIQVYGAGEHAGQNYFAMEYVDGKDLGEHLKDGLRPTYQESAEFMVQAVKGLATAGEHNLVHRDIKPGNMMVTDKGVLKIMDFGLVKLKNAEGGSTGGLTMAGAVMGTVNYFSPEQGRGEECDQTTDIYAVGVVFYQLLAGTLPFTGTDATSIIYQHIHAEPRPLSEINPNVPDSYQAIVSKCMQKDRRKRYQTASELLKDLELVIEGVRPQNAPMDPDQLSTGGSSVTDPKGSSHVGLVVLVLLLVAGAAGYYFWDQHKKQQYQAGQNVEQHADSTRIDSPVNPVQPTEVNPDPLAKAKEMMGTGDLVNAETLIQRFLAREPGNPDWLGLARRLDQLHAAAAVKSARSLIQEGKLSAASELLARARKLSGDTEEIDDLLKKIRVSSGMEGKLEAVRSLLSGGSPDKAVAALNELRSDAIPEVRKLRIVADKMKNELEAAHEILSQGDINTARGLFERSFASYSNKAAEHGLKALAPAILFKNALKDNQLNIAREQLKKMKLLIPESPAIAAAEQKIKIVEIVVRGRKAARDGDMETAQRALQQISTIIPDSAKEKEFKGYVKEYFILHDFRAAITTKNLQLAQEKLEKLKNIAPDSDAHRIAVREFNESKIEETDRLQKEKDFEAKVSQRVQSIKSLLLLADPDFSAVKKQVTDLSTFAGAERPELKEITLLIVKKKATIAIRQVLMHIDSAVLEGREQDLPLYVADEDFLNVLKRFIGKSDLVFKHTVEKFSLQNKAARVEAILTNKFDTFPQTDMKIIYQFLQVDGMWKIQSHAFEK